MLVFSSFFAVACDEQQVQGSVGGETDNNNDNRNTSSQGVVENSSMGQIQCVELPPITVTGYTIPGPLYFWMGGGVWLYYTHAGGGGTSANAMTERKLDFCLVEGTLQAIYNHWPILSDVSTIESYAQTAAGIQKIIWGGAIEDIKVYFSSGGLMHGPPSYTSENSINWYELNIQWSKYGDYPSGNLITNKQAYPVFAKFLKEMDMGNGKVDLASGATDSQPSVSCI